MEIKPSLQKKENPRFMPIRSGLKVGYRPVHGLVAPDGSKNWVRGWFDLDSMGRVAEAGSVPPPPPPE